MSTYYLFLLATTFCTTALILVLQVEKYLTTIIDDCIPKVKDHAKDIVNILKLIELNAQSYGTNRDFFYDEKQICCLCCHLVHVFF